MGLVALVFGDGPWGHLRPNEFGLVEREHQLNPFQIARSVLRELPSRVEYWFWGWLQWLLKVLPRGSSFMGIVQVRLLPASTLVDSGLERFSSLQAALATRFAHPLSPPSAGPATDRKPKSASFKDWAKRMTTPPYSPRTATGCTSAEEPCRSEGTGALRRRHRRIISDPVEINGRVFDLSLSNSENRGLAGLAGASQQVKKGSAVEESESESSESDTDDYNEQSRAYTPRRSRITSVLLSTGSRRGPFPVPIINTSLEGDPDVAFPGSGTSGSTPPGHAASSGQPDSRWSLAQIQGDSEQVVLVGPANFQIKVSRSKWNDTILFWARPSIEAYFSQRVRSQGLRPSPMARQRRPLPLTPPPRPSASQRSAYPQAPRPSVSSQSASEDTMGGSASQLNEAGSALHAQSQLPLPPSSISTPPPRAPPSLRMAVPSPASASDISPLLSAQQSGHSPDGHGSSSEGHGASSTATVGRQRSASLPSSSSSLSRASLPKERTSRRRQARRRSSYRETSSFLDVDSSSFAAPARSSRRVRRSTASPASSSSPSWSALEVFVNRNEASSDDSDDSDGGGAPGVVDRPVLGAAVRGTVLLRGDGVLLSITTAAPCAREVLDVVRRSESREPSMREVMVELIGRRVRCKSGRRIQYTYAEFRSFGMEMPRRPQSTLLWLLSKLNGDICVPLLRTFRERNFIEAVH